MYERDRTIKLGNVFQFPVVISGICLINLKYLCVQSTIQGAGRTESPETSSVLPALWERDCYLISNLRNASGIKYFTLSSVKPFARTSIRLLIYYMPEKVTKARALICTAVQIKNNDKLACSQLQPVTMK